MDEKKKVVENNSRDKNPVMHSKKLTRGQVAADWLAKWAGSWSFIGLFAVFIFLWAMLNN